MKRCARCEIDHPDSAPFCMACGGALDAVGLKTDATATGATQDPQPDTDNALPESAAKRTSIKLLPVAISLVIAIIVILVVAHYYRGVTLTIRTLPGGTSVVMDGRAMGTTGLDGVLTIANVKTGEHKLEMQHGGFNDVNQTISIKLTDLSKDINITLSPFGAETPTVTTKPSDAYKALYAAVKAKDTEAIKSHLSEATIEIMTTSAAAQKRPFPEVIANGLTESTAAPTLPELCPDRIKGRFGAVEVKRTDGKWEDLPFVIEKGEWKLAAGETFKGAYQMPGDPICVNAEPTPTPKP